MCRWRCGDCCWSGGVVLVVMGRQEAWALSVVSLVTL